MADSPEPEPPEDPMQEIRDALNDACSSSLEALLAECRTLRDRMDAHHDGTHRLPDEEAHALVARMGDLTEQLDHLDRMARCPRHAHDDEDPPPVSQRQWWQRQIDAMAALPGLMRRARDAGLPLMQWEIDEVGLITLWISPDMLARDDDEGPRDATAQELAQAFEAWVEFLGAEEQQAIVYNGTRTRRAASPISPAAPDGEPVRVEVRVATEAGEESVAA